MRRVAAFALLVGVATAGCGGGEPATCEPAGTELEVSVVQSHRFDTDCLAAPADQPFTIRLVNQDNSAHGVHDVTIRDESRDIVFQDELVRPGDEITYQVGPLTAGTYEFYCVNHTNMKGSFIVS